MLEHFKKYLAEGELVPAQWEKFCTFVTYISVNATITADFDKLAKALAGRENMVRVVFLSMAPSLFTATCSNLAATKLVTPKTRVVLEKPLGLRPGVGGRGGQRARRVDLRASTQIYRIDHYLGKEAVQNLIALRFGNTLFEPLWRRGRICNVQITVGEQVGVDGRGEFYDQTGALRDMVQSHLLQLLSIIAMEPPVSGEADAVRNEKLKVLHALQADRRAEVRDENRARAIQGRHRQGEARAGLFEETGVPPESRTETFVALKVGNRNVALGRGAVLPAHRENLQEQIAEIVVTFDKVPHSIFEAGRVPRPNQLVIQLQPDESITLVHRRQGARARSCA